ncbi:MAG: magnesium transporter [Desulfobacteraceae bacterium]|jgi:magnesium transporter|nr:magnesium transporter [Desulfobacteraceae bacterium]
MLVERNRILAETIKRLMRRGATARLPKIISKVHAADLPEVFPSLSVTNQQKLFQLIHDPEKKALVISELDEDISLNIIESLSLEELAEIMDNMPSDDSVAFIKMLPQNKADAVLGMMGKIESEEVEDLLRYEDDTAGSIMIPDFIALKENMTAKDVIDSLQSQEYLDVEMAFYVYVVDKNDRLVGVSSLRQLVVVPSSTPLYQFMGKEVISVTTDMDQEEVAKIVARYNILAVPVVDEDERMVGIVTVDDVIDVFREEATEDILKMAGVGEEFVETKSIVRSTRIRLPWLFASCVGGLIASVIIGRFQLSLSKATYLAVFIPVIMGMGGNIGIQSSTIVVRGLATGRLHIKDIWSSMSKEIAIGFILGSFYGLLVGIVAQLRYEREFLALAVGLSVACSMTLAALSGSMMPMLFARINIDPAVATGPFVTTAIDILSVSFYFLIATKLLCL